ncbi:augmin subunit 5-like protein [Tanacetum coccineum]
MLNIMNNKLSQCHLRAGCSSLWIFTEALLLYVVHQMSAIAHVFLVPQNRSVRTPHVNGVVNAQKSLDDCKYITGLLEEWWEQPASTVAAWKCVLLSCLSGGEKLSIVSQEPVLFNSSIEDNIASVFDGKVSTFDIKKVACSLTAGRFTSGLLSITLIVSGGAFLQVVLMNMSVKLQETIDYPCFKLLIVGDGGTGMS